MSRINASDNMLVLPYEQGLMEAQKDADALFLNIDIYVSNLALAG